LVILVVEDLARVEVDDLRRQRSSEEKKIPISAIDRPLPIERPGQASASARHRP